MGLVALLLAVDMLILTAWYLTDPIRCSRSVAAAFKVLFKKKGLRCKNSNESLYHSVTFPIVGDGETNFLLPVSDGHLLLCILWLVGNHHGCKEGKWCLFGTEVALKNDCEFFHCLNTIYENSWSDNKPTVFLVVFFFLLKAVAFPALIAQCALIIHVDGCKLIQEHILKASFRLPIHWFSLYLSNPPCPEVRSDLSGSLLAPHHQWS